MKCELQPTVKNRQADVGNKRSSSNGKLKSQGRPINQISTYSGDNITNSNAVTHKKPAMRNEPLSGCFAVNNSVLRDSRCKRSGFDPLRQFSYQASMIHRWTTALHLKNNLFENEAAVPITAYRAVDKKIRCQITCTKLSLCCSYFRLLYFKRFVLRSVTSKCAIAWYHQSVCAVKSHSCTLSTFQIWYRIYIA